MKMKKLLAALLAVCMLLTMLPVAAFAADDVTEISISVDEDGNYVVIVDGIALELNDNEYYGESFYFSGQFDELVVYDGKYKLDVDTELNYFCNYGIVVDSFVKTDSAWNCGIIQNSTFETKEFYSGRRLEESLFEEDEEVDCKVENSKITTGYLYNEGEINGGSYVVQRIDNYMIVKNCTISGTTESEIYNFGEISNCDVTCVYFQNGGQDYEVALMETDETTKNTAVTNGVKIDAEYAVYNYGIISNSTIDCQYFQNGYYSSYQPALAGEDEESAKYIFSNSKLNALDIYNEAGAVFERIDCGDCSVHTQFYAQMLGNQQAGEYPYYGTLTWDTVKCDSLSMSANNGNGQTYTEWEVTSADALTDTKWQWPSKAWFDSLELVTAAEPVNNQYIYFTVPAGYKLSIVENDFVLHKEVPKPPVIEEEIEKETYDIVVRVKFDGVDEDEIDFVNAQLLKNGKAYKKAVKVDAKDEWRHEWVDVDDSSKIEWTVTADEIEGYNMEIENVRANYWTITLSAKDVVAEKANPETGAADFVGAAVAMAVVSVAAAGALALKK